MAYRNGNTPTTPRKSVSFKGNAPPRAATSANTMRMQASSSPTPTSSSTQTSWPRMPGCSTGIPRGPSSGTTPRSPSGTPGGTSGISGSSSGVPGSGASSGMSGGPSAGIPGGAGGSTGMSGGMATMYWAPTAVNIPSHPQSYGYVFPGYQHQPRPAGQFQGSGDASAAYGYPLSTFYRTTTTSVANYQLRNYMQPNSMYGYPTAPYQQRCDYSYVPQQLNKLFFNPPPPQNVDQPQNYFVPQGETIPPPGYLLEGMNTNTNTTTATSGEMLPVTTTTPPSSSLSSVPRPRAIYQGVNTRLNFLDPGVQSSMSEVFRNELQRQTGTLLSITEVCENDTWLDIVSFEFKISNFSYVKGKPVKELVAVVSILSKYDGRLGFQFDIVNDELAKNCNISVELLQQVCEKVCI